MARMVFPVSTLISHQGADGLGRERQLHAVLFLKPIRKRQDLLLQYVLLHIAALAEQIRQRFVRTPYGIERHLERGDRR